jgi:hypothetical protein
MVGNGGSNGFVRYDVMQVPVHKYGFAVTSTVSTGQQMVDLSTCQLIQVDSRNNDDRITATMAVLPTERTPFKTQRPKKISVTEL